MNLDLTPLQQEMLDGEFGEGTRIAMEIIVTLAKIYDAKNLIPVSSCQISGVSYGTIGDAGIEFLESLIKGGTKVRTKATLNPCGMDLEAWEEMGIPREFRSNQLRVLNAYAALGIEATYSCTPYLLGNCPKLGDHVAWSESSAISYVNSVIGARTNREGGPSALAAALTGFTGNYGLHLPSRRKPTVHVHVNVPVGSYFEFGRLGLILGSKLENDVPLITGLNERYCTNENLKQLGASMAANGAVALYHIAGITQEAKSGLMADMDSLREVNVESLDVSTVLKQNHPGPASLDHFDLVFLGCPHLSLGEIESILDGLRGKAIKTKVWIATARDIKRKLMSKKGIFNGIDKKVKIISDTCIIVCPVNALLIKNIITNSGKAFKFLRDRDYLNVIYDTTENCLAAATGNFT